MEHDLVNRVALVTGATSGIGEEAAGMLAARGAKVIFGVRNPSKARRIAQALRDRYPGQALDLVIPPEAVPPLDLADPASIARFAAALLSDTATPLHILLNNAGSSMLPGPGVNDQGVNSLVQVNFLGPYQLTRLLEAKLVAGKARIVTVSSVTHRCYEIPADPRVFLHTTSSLTYPWTKLANVLLAYELQRRLGSFGVESCAVDPGGVRTAIWDEVPALAHPPASWVIEALYAPPADGAEVLVTAATLPWDEDRAPEVLDPRHDLRYYARGAFASPALTLVDGAWRHWLGFVRPSLYGAAVVLHSFADYPARHWSGGRIFNQTVPVRSALQTYDTHLAAALWSYCDKVAGLDGGGWPPPPLEEAAAHVDGGTAALEATGGHGKYDSPRATPTRKRAVMSPVQGFAASAGKPPLPQPQLAPIGVGTSPLARTPEQGGGNGGAWGSVSGGANARRRRVVARARDSDGEEADAAPEPEGEAAYGHYSAAATAATTAGASPADGALPPLPVEVPPPPQTLRHLAQEHGVVLPGTAFGGATSAAAAAPAGGGLPVAAAAAPSFLGDLSTSDRAPPPSKRLHVAEVAAEGDDSSAVQAPDKAGGSAKGKKKGQNKGRRH
ncbi:WW domain-containing oxidoreductase [Tetrabaena socialis]|uniref:WW domain-containing oxidoreductase n=1 Tax=Tetrabaena socialis TaxID=47790 RepID=A0A2J7ZXE8_9CHLO|nr:WW domain-containing oxidoreductase [Tetrabaena socialis]|eukprot:PNH04950.1 WW domain-containing oxidoreductase [Tetrabaena socialis]